ncbi:hypothetical protein EMIHUDRAFT_198759 [Emiliania huxleyi CCMP1516]|uniref:Uncharacterized protein n=2 Tax=Emiliania huxleyi TaxID=2903 RepID=A0A0D3I7T5_EMIH1|nr:hypothetical protein EMIHUDRAFT_198759 [Emiliania huxleyi CCMP1516]EOD07320.1 hypothetical protein EMIHUDRAFT_198759 [Emiliania huxleyi CCMP1516]|eukprot:XP_005759749.1 hypothetical protein EMIHUDRAFT_198759 [Emiliania huxleyi CCMP1516]
MSLGDAIGRNQTLTRLNLSLNDIAPEGGASLARGLRGNTSLTQLTLVRCGLGPGGGRALGEALETNRHLLSLDVEQNDLGVEGGVAFGRALAVNTSLATGMRSNRIGYGLERATAFAKALEVKSPLTCLGMSVTRELVAHLPLNLAQNELGAVGGAAFAAALRRNTGLRRNSTCGATSSDRTVARQSGLTRLDLSDNAIGSDGVSSL